MGLTMRQKQAVTRQLALRYQRARKKERGAILDWLSDLTSYQRCYLARQLRERSKPKRLVLSPARNRPHRRGRARTYDQKELAALREIWAICDFLCGKRLAPYLPEIISVLERWGEIELEEEVKGKLLQISPATIDRLLAAERERYQLRARAKTKPGSLLKHQIPIRTFSEWNEARPGFVEIDLVGHEGGNSRGDYIQTLDVTDVCTGWTETRAVKNKAQVWVFAALLQIKGRVPFAILGIDSDNVLTSKSTLLGGKQLPYASPLVKPCRNSPPALPLWASTVI